MRKVALHTLGCKLNFSETASIAGQFRERGFDVVDFGADADVVVLNTCTVTEKADRECRQLVRRALRNSPQAYVIVTGCYAQLQPAEIAAIEGVDLVLGSKEKFELFEHASFEKAREPIIRVGEISFLHEASIADSAGFQDRTRAFLKIQDGCDYHCSFCTIPLARGQSRSVSVYETRERAERIVSEGYREIVLTGVNVGDYGKNGGATLLGLLRELHKVNGLERIRISSIEPNLLSDELLEWWTGSDRMCKHFHIPLQSGSDSVLKRMRRRYTTDRYSERLKFILDRVPGAGVGADVIVGFPGETENEFEQTYRLLVEQPLSYLHVFNYSARADTDAGASEEQVPPPVRNERSERLRNLSERKRNAFYRKHIGTHVTVLFEGEKNPGSQTGWTGEYVRVNVQSTKCLENQVRRVRIDGVFNGACIGTVVSENAWPRMSEKIAI